MDQVKGGSSSPITTNSCFGEDAPERAAISETVESLNEIYTRKGLETAVAMGRLVIERFFDGDPERFRLRGREHVSFRELAEHPGLIPSSTLLWRSVAITAQLPQLPAETVEQLTVSHHVALLPLRDRTQKAALAQLAVEQGLSRRELERKVREVRRHEAPLHRRGRPPLPALLKALTKFEESLALCEEEPLDYRTVRRIDLQEPVPRVIKRVDEVIDRIARQRQELLESDYGVENVKCRQKWTR